MSNTRPPREALTELAALVDQARALTAEIAATGNPALAKWARSRRGDLMRLLLEVVRRVALEAVAEAGAEPSPTTTP